MPEPQLGTQGDVLGGRIGAQIIDNVLSTIAAIVGFGVFFGLAVVTDVSQITLVGIVVAPVVYFGYYIYLEGRNGQTPGKSLLGIMAVNEDGSDIDMTTSAIRNIIKLVLDGNVIGLVVILVTEDDQRIGDIAAGTLVVRAK